MDNSRLVYSTETGSESIAKGIQGTGQKIGKTDESG